MTSTAIEKIKEINKIKRDILFNDKKILETTNIDEYNKLDVISKNLHLKLLNEVQLLANSISTTIEFEAY